MAGAPKGNSNAAKGREWANALERALRLYESKKRKISRGQALERIANTVIEEALDGGMWAVQEIGNRMDGKAAQSLDITGSIEHKHANELTDAELANIATGRSTGAAEPQEGETVLN
jgi:uncharacterized protein YutE (UPF0331/DUF86 family)